MRLVFMGTPRFAVEPLQALVEAGHEIAGVVTRIDKPSGRGRVMTSPPVKRAAEQMGLTVYQPGRVRDPEFIDILQQIKPAVIVVAAYGQILPKEILSLPRHGCINIHASLLPFYRGAAPINWAIIRGETETGITIMQMDEGMDTGAILMQEGMPIGPDDSAGTLTEKLSVQGARLIAMTLLSVEKKKLKPMPQDDGKATLAPPLKKEDGLVDWNLSAAEIRNRIRGLTPWPGAYTFLDGTMMKILDAECVAGDGESGMIYQIEPTSLDIGTGHGLLRIRELQPSGKKAMRTADFLHGHRGIAGKRLQNE